MRLFDLHAIVAFLMFAIFGSMVVTAAGYRHEARLVPLVVGIPALLLAAWQMYVEIRQGGELGFEDLLAAPADTAIESLMSASRLLRSMFFLMYSTAR